MAENIILKQKQIREVTASRQEIRDDIRGLVMACKNLVSARLNCSAYRFEPAADRGIGEHFEQLLGWVDKADLQDAELDDLGENITRLPCRR